MLTQIEGIIFDLDDTLYNKADWMLPAIEFAATNLNMDVDKIAEIAHGYVLKRGYADADLINHVLISCGQSDSALNVRAFLSWANQYRPEPGSMPLHLGVKETLTKLRHHFKLGIIADGPVDCQQAKIEALGLRLLVDVIVYSDDIDGPRSRRPDPRPMRKAIRLMHTRSTRTVFVGDNPLKDFKRSREMGFLTVRVMTGEYSKFDYPTLDHKADRDISSVARLTDVIHLPQMDKLMPTPISEIGKETGSSESDVKYRA